MSDSSIPSGFVSLALRQLASPLVSELPYAFLLLPSIVSVLLGFVISLEFLPDRLNPVSW